MAKPRNVNEAWVDGRRLPLAYAQLTEMAAGSSIKWTFNANVDGFQFVRAETEVMVRLALDDASLSGGGFVVSAGDNHLQIVGWAKLRKR